MSQPRSSSNSLLFAQLGVDTFDARRRKLTHSFAARLLASGNGIISLLLRSKAFPRTNPCLSPCKREGWLECVPYALKNHFWDQQGVCILCEEQGEAVLRASNRNIGVGFQQVDTCETELVHKFEGARRPNFV
ncbi:hypothetical protein Bbelb_387970 [Branchiostoma belcheri]|nr:hypothetical protein Bbelb_387970 [Branchiostoma belcheri]